MSGSAKCVMRQLKQLEKQPVLGAAAAPCNDNLSEIHCNVVGQTGAYKGIVVHFVLEIGSNYPMSAPNAYFVTPITYHGGAVMTDSKGRREVCLNIFGNFSRYHGEWGSTNEGWSPGYTLETVLVQMQSLLSNEDGLLSTNSSDVEAARKHSNTTKCPCQHTGSEPFPSVPKEAGPCSITPLDNIVCYSSGARLDEEDSILGIGVNVTRGGLDTTGEILSHEAFKRGVRKSSDNLRTFGHFLPISHTDEHHERVVKLGLFQTCLEGIAKEQSGLGKQPPVEWVMRLVEVGCSLMTALVVEVAKNPKGPASDKFIECYYSVLDTLRRVDEKRVATKYADNLMSGFTTGDLDLCVKSKVPNLGWLLALLPLSSYSWDDISESVLLELEVRSVFWVVQGTHSQRPPHPELLSPSAPGLVEKMFNSTSVGRNLMYFQSLFESLAKKVLSKDMSIEEAKASIKGSFAKVKGISSWEEHYAFLGAKPCDDQNARLLRAVQRSEKCGYHGAGGKKGKGGKGGKKGGGKGGKGGKRYD